jgi:adenosylcobinamide kinase/adenosylcobinamide-phosphate guanylyltransferase
LSCVFRGITQGRGDRINLRLLKVFSRVTFILGGAASGKSVFAEKLTEKHSDSRIYLATSHIFDTETQVKIDTHIARRGTGWTLIEAPLALAPALRGLQSGQICLLDCATMWLANHLLAGSDLAAEQAGLLAAIAACPASLVIVSNEVGQGIVPDNALARRFREAQGRLNIALAAAAETAVLVTAGLPLVLKGRLP